jgi:hypothetical protein
MGLVAEMRSGLKQLLHGDDIGRHGLSPSGFTSVRASHQPFGWHRYVRSTCGMAGPVAEGAAGSNPMAGLDTTRTNREHIDLTRRSDMFAFVSSIAFAGAAYLAGSSVLRTYSESRIRIGDALRGRPLTRVNPVLNAAA